ncbi:MAG: hypothetical protein LAN18_00695 [Acidobacteriia bacterium]|nr:hypothetical protein [Terriglobia bacterium]
MRKLFLTACSIVIFSSVCFAQTATPRWELMGGYTTYLAGGEYASVLPDGSMAANPGQLPAKGFQIGLSRSIKSYFRVTGELNGLFGKEVVAVEHLPAGGQYKTGYEIMALFGPEATVRTLKHFDVFAHYLIGFSYGVDNQVPAVANNTFTSWVYGTGVGLDLKTRHRLAIRLLEADWIISHFPKQDFNAEDNWRFTSGVVYRFGH